tara:strand:+ start:348 stop:611 length:264 start_codon:yes stop_codon:yes gene_type:complete
MSQLVENNTITNNGTHIIIKQIFVTLNPEEYVRWSDLFNFLAFYLLLYFLFCACFALYKKKKQLAQAPAQAIVVGDDGVRVLNVSTE